MGINSPKEYRGILAARRSYKLWFYCLLAIFIISLCFSRTREAHILCARLVFHIEGDIEMAGSDPDRFLPCPSAHFSERYAFKLRERSTNSLADYITAYIARPSIRMETPEPRPALAKDPLLEWATLEIACSAWQEYSLVNTTNRVTPSAAEQAIQRAMQFIHLAQAENATNGAMWLTEAALLFTQGQDAQAVKALKLAAAEKTWTTAVATNFDQVSRLLQRDGLSELDAVLKTKGDLPAYELKLVQFKCEKGLMKLVTAAIKDNDRDQFSNLLNLIYYLGKAESPERLSGLENEFLRYNSFLRSEPLDAMASKLGKTSALEAANQSKRPDGKIKIQIFKEYALLNANSNLVENYLCGIQNYETERALIEEKTKPLWLKYYDWLLRSIFSGSLAVLGCAGVVAIFLFESTILFLHRRLAKAGAKLSGKNFYLPIFLASLFCSSLLALTCLELGLFRENHKFGEPENLTVEEVVIAFVVNWVPLLFPLGVDFTDRKKGKPIHMEWPCTITLATFYMIFILLMAICRHETAILANWRFS